MSLLAIGVAQDPRLTDRLAWRGGTCLHQLHLERARRYSEDLDYVLVAPMRHASVVNALRDVVTELGMECERQEISPAHVKLWAGVEVPAASGVVRVKFEVNCADAEPILDLARVRHGVETRVWQEEAHLLTYQAAELVGTKFRALAQRRKGRDLSDLWLARRELLISSDVLARAADHYLAHEEISPPELRQRIAAHLRDPDFGRDLKELTTTPYEGYKIVEAGHRLIQWTDKHLDPLYNERRSRNAVRRDRQRWKEEGGWAPGKIRCPRYEEVSGNLSRCDHWYEPGGECPSHG